MFCFLEKTDVMLAKKEYRMFAIERNIRIRNKEVIYALV